MSEIPKTCKAAVLFAYGAPLQICEVNIPAVQAGGILVKVEIAGVCGTDIHMQEGTLGIKAPLPYIMGHEAIGRIVELGAGRTHDVADEPLQVGDRIMWAHSECNDCYTCNVLREPVMCDHRTGYGMSPLDQLMGGFAEYEYIMPVTKVVKVPEELSDEACIGVSCAFRSVVAAFERLGAVGIGDTVVIQGSGPIGLYSLALARSGGAGKIIVVGAPENRLALAKKWGADEVINIETVRDAAERKKLILEMTDGRGPALAIECSGYPPAFAEGVEMVEKGGRYLVIGQTSPHPIQFSPYYILSKNMQIIGSGSATIEHYYKALRFLRYNRDKYSFADMVTNKYPLEQINEALENMKAGREIKPVIVFNRG